MRSQVTLADPDLGRLVGAVVEALDPEAIYLFGSRAKGTDRADSDYDLLAVVSDRTPSESLSPARLYAIARRAKLPADIVPCRASAFARWKDSVGTLAYEASRNGMLIYGA
jgi:predicted nucleotidyltransferase